MMQAHWATGGVTIFQYNYTHGNQGGFWLDCAGINKDSEHIKTVLRYNVSVDDEQYLVRAGNELAEIYNNTFYKSEGKLDACYGNSGTNHKFWNNIFYFPATPDWASSVFENNIYYPCEACPTDDLAITLDPQLVSPGPAEDGISFADNFMIADTSPCIGNGIYIPDNGGLDFWSNSLDKGSYDIGAHQTDIVLPAEDDTYVFTRDFSTSQGTKQWYYMEKSGDTYMEMIWDSGQQKWTGSYAYNLIWAPGNMHPDTNDTVVAWKAPKSGDVQIIGKPKKVNTGYDGVNVKIVKSNTPLWPESGWQFIEGSDSTGVAHIISTVINQGDWIYFIVNQNSNNYADETYWSPTIVYE